MKAKKRKSAEKRQAKIIAFPSDISRGTSDNLRDSSNKTRGRISRELLVERVIRTELNLLDSIAEHIERANNANFIEEGWRRFAIGWNVADDPAVSASYAPYFLLWFVFFWAPSHCRGVKIPKDEKNKSLGRVLLEKHSDKLDESSRRHLELTLQTPFSFFRLERYEDGVGMHLYDLVLHRSVFVDDPTIEAATPVGAILLLRPVAMDDCCIAGGVAPTALRPMCAWKLHHELEGKGRWTKKKAVEQEAFLRQVYFMLVNKANDQETLFLLDSVLSRHRDYSDDQWARFIDSPAIWLDGQTLRQAAKNPKRRRLVSAFFDELDLHAMFSDTEDTDIRSKTVRIRKVLDLPFPEVPPVRDITR